jgi:hypothetical protein
VCGSDCQDRDSGGVRRDACPCARNHTGTEITCSSSVGGQLTTPDETLSARIHRFVVCECAGYEDAGVGGWFPRGCWAARRQKRTVQRHNEIDEQAATFDGVPNFVVHGDS